MKKQLLSIILPAALTLSANAEANAPVPPLDDNGDASFVRQIVPKLLGRKPKGTEEIKLLADITDLHGREAMVRMLMEQPEFENHWTATLIDHLQMQRETSRAQSPQCFDGPMVSTAGGGAKLIGGGLGFGNGTSPAEFVRDNDITSSYPNEFNMYDLIHSSIEIDNLFPVYRAYLYPVGAKRNVGGMQSAAENRAAVGAAFDEIYLHRNLECMSCHRGTYSTTGIGDRTHPLYKTLDQAIFDHTGLGENVPDIENELYQTNCAACHGAKAEGTGSAPGVLDATAEEIADAINNVANMSFLSGLLNEADIESIEESLLDPGAFGNALIGETAAKHYAVFRSDLFAIEDPSTGWAPWGMSKECASINGKSPGESIPGYFAGIESNFASILDVDDRLLTGYQNLGDLLHTLPFEDNNGSIDGDLAFAYLLAANITENVWEQLMGKPLTLINYYARNIHQKNQHQYLTEDVFIGSQWSLKELMVEILRSRFFNRHAPVSSSADDPYVLHPIFDPLVPADQQCQSAPARGDRVISDTLVSNEQCAFNGQGELIHRYAPRVLLQSVSASLGWPSPRIFPEANDYPSIKLNKAIGQYISDFDQGSKDVSFQALLNWDGTFGTCNKEGIVDGNDWIDRLHEQIDAFNLANPEHPLTLADVVLTIKDWIIQEPVFGGYKAPGSSLHVADAFALPGALDLNPSEAQLIESFFADMPISSPVTSGTVSKAKLRELCGVYLKSPQFMLAGIVRHDSFEPTRFRVCNEEPCFYKAMCQSYQPALADLGFETNCSDSSVSKPLSGSFTGNTVCPDTRKSSSSSLPCREDGIKDLSS